MSNYESCWLPPIERCKDFTQYDEYVDSIYNIFQHDFIYSSPSFDGLLVKTDLSVGISGKARGFEHVITNDFEKNKKRYPDFPRCERIRWIRAFIENYTCKENIICGDDECDGLKVWKKRQGKHHRIVFLFEEEYFIVIIEQRKDCYFLVTAYYINYDHTMDKLVDEYEASKNKITPL